MPGGDYETVSKITGLSNRADIVQDSGSPPIVKQFRWYTFKRNGGLTESGSIDYVQVDDLPDTAQSPNDIYYIDTIHGTHLLGEAAHEVHLNAGGHPADVRHLETLLLSGELDQIHANTFRETRGIKMDREACLRAGSFIVSKVANIKERGATISKKIVRRANVLGLLLSPDQIVDEFGSLATFYTQLGEASASRNRMFDHWTIHELANSLSALGKELGHKPNEREINDRARNDPNHPSSHIIGRLCGDLRAALDAAGWPNIYNWDISDHERHGVRFMLANDGMEPTQKAWDFLSKEKRGPSASVLRFKYENGFSEFKDKVKLQYEAEVVRREAHRKEVANMIQADIDSRVIDRSLFRGVKSGQEMIERYAKLKVVYKTVPSATYKEAVAIALSSNFVELIHLRSRCGPNELKDAAQALGHEDDIWPDVSLTGTLRIIDDPKFIEFRKRKNALKVYIPQQPMPFRP